jgi:hypothetical protein
MAGCLVALLAAPAQGAPGDESASSAPLSGILRADGAPLAGVSLVVQGLTGAAASVVRVLKTDAEGTFCLADARPGIYSILAAVPGFRSASAQVLHRTTADSLSFVRLDLDRERRGVLPSNPTGTLDPWAARAVLAGDVLRETGPADAAPPPTPVATLPALSPDAGVLPVQGSLSSLQGFGAEGVGTLSQTSLDVRGSLGAGVKWGLSGEYDRVMSPTGARVGGASRVALDVLPGEGHSIRVSSQRSELPTFGNPDARFDAHSVDWDANAGRRSRASVSARILSHRNLEPAALPTSFFRDEGSALEIDARYRSELGEGRFVRVHLGYRSDLTDGSTTNATTFDREARVGGVAGVRLLDALLVEAGGTVDYSVSSRGVTPELTLSLDPLEGLTVYGFAARRYDQSVPGAPVFAVVGVDPSDLVRATRALYRVGTRLTSHATGRVELEASRREISEAFQLLLDNSIVDRIDALYLFPGDVAGEISGSVTFALRANLAARLSLLGGQVSGDGWVSGALPNEARYWLSSARVEVQPSGTSVSVRYRFLEQELGKDTEAYRLGRESVDVTLAQEIPIPALRALGTRWQVLFTVAMGTRQDGDAEPRPNRQMAGGLALSF